jgi:hypothetical protein
MPYITIETEEYISVNEFISMCESDDIKEIIHTLDEEGHLDKFKKNDRMSLHEENHRDNCIFLIENYYRISAEEEQIISNIVKKYK